MREDTVALGRADSSTRRAWPGCTETVFHYRKVAPCSVGAD